ncbi:MAG: hypothetical protein KC643_13895 [Nitrospira sp.]|nr:hypothetical protein [Nitrospira sp.]
MSSLYALFIFVPFLFLGFLIYAPFRLFKEQEQARQEHLGELEKVKQELRELKTPKVSLSIYTIDKETDEYKVETIVLKAMSHSIGPISVTLKAVDIQNIECVQFAPTIHISPDGTEAIKLDKDEHKHFIAVSYNPTSNSLRVNVPFETHAPQVAKGNEFFITIKAFGPTEPATIRFHFGVEDGWLWYREEGSTEKISYKTLMEKAWPLP